MSYRAVGLEKRRSRQLNYNVTYSRSDNLGSGGLIIRIGIEQLSYTNRLTVAVRKI